MEAGPSKLVTAQLPVTNLSLFTLIDSGATHSFIANKVADKLEWKKECLAYPFITMTPAGKVYKSQKWFKDVSVKIGNKKLLTNLVVIEMDDYDVILGMDWLSSHQALIDYRGKKVEFRPPKGTDFEFKGTSRSRLVPTISALRAQIMLAVGCTEYLAHIIDKTTEVKLEANDVSIVWEFLSVLPKDLPGLLPGHEVEFSIELLPRTSPISKAPYRLAAAELEESKT